MAPPRSSEYDIAKSATRYSKSTSRGRNGAPAYHVCSNYSVCGGWELVRNHASYCRVSSCRSKMVPATNEQRHRSGERPQRSSSHHPDHSGGGAKAKELSPAELLAPHLSKLEKQFPGLSTAASQVFAPEPLAPAAALHSAQSACQIALKSLQAAENTVAELDKDCAELAIELRAKIADLSSAQIILAEARVSYDDKARAAQVEVRKSKSNVNDEVVQITELFHQMDVTQLEKISKAIADAVLAANSKSEPMAVDTNAEPEAAVATGNETPKGGAALPSLPILPVLPGSGAPPLLPSPPLPTEPPGAAVRDQDVDIAEEELPDNEADLPQQSAAVEPLVPPKEKERQGSRSPRRQTDEKSDAHSGVSRASSVASAGRTAKKSEHYATIASELEATLANANAALRGSGVSP